MPRIRSIHPGFFTDDEIAGLSDSATLFLIGLWTQADDQGVFEWKPAQLRIRLRPCKDGSVEGLLSELEGAHRILSFEINGRKLGAIRNFRRFQRPKVPNALFVIPDEIRNYVALTQAISEITEAKQPPLPPKAEKSPQREEGGGGMKEEGGTPSLRSGGRSPPAARGSRLASDWLLPDEWHQFAADEGMDPLSIEREALKFRDHWHSATGPNSRKADWFATWRNWIRRNTDGKAGQAERGSDPSTLERAREIVRAREAGGAVVELPRGNDRAVLPAVSGG